MYQKTATAGMNNAEWLALRKTGIGGSDAGTVCGLNPYSSPMKLFHENWTTKPSVRGMTLRSMSRSGLRKPRD